MLWLRRGYSLTQRKTKGAADSHRLPEDGFFVKVTAKPQSLPNL